MSENNKRVNWLNAQGLTNDDLEQEQKYHLTHEDVIRNAIGDGVIDKGLQVLPDTIIAEPVSIDDVLVASPAGDDQNIHWFPETINTITGSISSIVEGYTVFQAKANNIQRINLRAQVLSNDDSMPGSLRIEIRSLINADDPLSLISNTILASAAFNHKEIPIKDSEELLVIDFSAFNTNQGISLVRGKYYAIFFSFASLNNSLGLYHSRLSNASSLDDKLYTWFAVNQKYQQGTESETGTLELYTLYHKIYSSAIQVTKGKGLVNGKLLDVLEDIRYIDLVDRRNFDENTGFGINFVTASFVETPVDKQPALRTSNPVFTKIEESVSLNVFTKAQWDVKVANEENKNHLLLAVVSDLNIVPFKEIAQITPTVVNNQLAYHDWINPTNSSPSQEALNIKSSFSNGFVFFVSNVPIEVPLYDLNGNLVLETEDVYDQFGGLTRAKGDPIKERVEKVVLLVYLNKGTQIREFELSPISTTSSGSVTLRSYSGVFSLEQPIGSPIFSYQLDPNEITPNTFYNFVLYTNRGAPVYIQDFNKPIITGTSQGFSSLRENIYPITLEQGALTVIIDEDLQLGEVRADGVSLTSSFVDSKATQIIDETAKPVGDVQQGSINDRIDTVHPVVLPNPVFHVLGDIDGDGYVTQKDVDLAQQHYDGNITLSDLQVLKALVSRTGIYNLNTVTNFYGRVITLADIAEMQNYVDGNIRYFTGSTITQTTDDGSLQLVTFVDKYKLGDLTGLLTPQDGLLSQLDLAYLQEWLQGTRTLSPEQLLRAELCGNTAVDVGANSIDILGVPTAINVYSVIDGSDYEALLSALGVNNYTFPIETDMTVRVDRSYSFGPTPMASNGTRLLTDTNQIKQAYINGELIVKVDLYDGKDGVDVTYSGLTDRDQGGTGQQFAVTITIDPLDVVSLIGSGDGEIKLRDQWGRNNTDVLGSPKALMDTGGLVIVRGRAKSTGSNAGFELGTDIFVYIDDRQAFYDLGGTEPVTFIYDGSTEYFFPPTENVKYLAPAKFFRELSYYNPTTGVWEPDVAAISDFDARIGPPKGTLAFETDPYHIETHGRVFFSLYNNPPAGSTITIVYKEYKETIFDVDYFKLRNSPLGTFNGQLVANNDVVNANDDTASVIEAQDIDPSSSPFPIQFPFVQIKIDGVNVTSNDILSVAPPIGQEAYGPGYSVTVSPYVIVADTGDLSSGEIAIDPTTGRIRFFKRRDRFGRFVSEGPSSDQSITVSYYTVKFLLKNNPTQSVASYDEDYDFNLDGKIDETDLQQLLALANVNTQIGVNDPNVIYDFNGDQVIDSLDVDIFSQHFGAVQSGVPDYAGASTLRLASILIYKEDEPLQRIKVVRALSKPISQTSPRGKTVLFFDETTPVVLGGRYVVQFGFSSQLSLGEIKTDFNTISMLPSNLDLTTIIVKDGNNNQKEVVSLISEVNDDLTYKNTIFFFPAISEPTTLTIKSQWEEGNIGIYGKHKLVATASYENDLRKHFGPFRLDYDGNSFRHDGTSIITQLADSTFVGDVIDSGKAHLFGVPLEDLKFSAFLYVPDTEGGTAKLWVWHNLIHDPFLGGIELSHNDNLFIDHRLQGKNGALVLTPFGLGNNQVILKPKFAGGDIENDLSNLLIVRDDLISKYVAVHSHKDERSGGILTSDDIVFIDPRSVFASGTVTDIVYQLLDEISRLRKDVNDISRAQILRWDNPLLNWDTGLFWDSSEV